jgi:hypothetical protein
VSKHEKSPIYINRSCNALPDQCNNCHPSPFSSNEIMSSRIRKTPMCQKPFPKKNDNPEAKRKKEPVMHEGKFMKEKADRCQEKPDRCRGKRMKQGPNQRKQSQREAMKRCTA